MTASNRSIADWLGTPELGLVRAVRPSQVRMAEIVGEIIEGGGIAFVEAGTGTGKCLKLGTLVLRYNGEAVAVEDVVGGDLLLGPDGEPRTVLATTRGFGPLYRIVPNKGTPWVCNDAHVLTLVHTVHGEMRDVPLPDYLRWSGTQKHLYKQVQAPRIESFGGRAGAQPVSPYFLGAWLGDGTKMLNVVAVTKPDAEIELACRDEAARFGLDVRVVRDGACPSYHLVLPGGQSSAAGLTKETRKNPLLTALREMMAAGVCIPDAYRFGSAAVRSEVLAGLLDTDGHLTCNTYEIVQVRAQLAEDIAFVARSLGFRVTHGTKVVGGMPYHRLFISGDVDQIPLRVARKVAKARTQVKDVRRTGFRVEPVGDGDYAGFTLDGDHRFLLADFTVTHNSFAYGLPAALSDKRVVISTAKKALQAQLVDFDLPHVARVVRARPYAVLKGKGNYACHLRWSEFATSAAAADVPPADLAAFEDWLHASEDADMAGAVDRPWVHYARVQECVRKHCAFNEQCGYVRSRERATTAQVLVVNHALLATDLAIGGGKVLGPYDVLIIDEGHQAPKYFRDAFSLRLTSRQPEILARLLRGTDLDSRDLLGHLYTAIFAEMPRRSEAFYLTRKLEPLFEQLDHHVASSMKVMASRGLLGDEDEDGDSLGSGVTLARARARMRTAATLVTKIRKLCDIVLGREDAEDKARGVEWVKYIDKAGRDDISLIVTPLEVGPLVAPALLGVERVVVTSATLSTLNGMAYMAREYGLADSQITHKVVLPSPFDYASRSALYVGGDTPDPTTRGAEYYDAMALRVHELLAASRGGAIVLCASTEDMNELHERIYRKFHPLPYKLSRQGQGLGPEENVRWFKQGYDRVFMGLKTFWEGVDIPGDHLRLVVIPRLPFPNKGDVVSAARQARYTARLLEDGVSEKSAGIRAWEAFSLQEAIMDLKQGAGRLIRTESDRGIVAILDKRAYKGTKNYSGRVRGCLPHPELDDKQMVMNILAGFAAQALGGG